MSPPPRSGVIAPGVAFVTGGARGLGNAVAVSFAKEGATAVVLVDIADDQTFQVGKAAVEQYGAKCLTVRADVTNEPDVERAVAEAVQAFGRIDYAANFAGIVGPLGMSWDIDVAQWRKVIEVNTVGVWLCMKHELVQMKLQEPNLVEPGRVGQRGSIVNCASVNSVQAGAGTTGYTASKHAVAGLTKAGALEARQFGVRVNAVSPGFLRTKLLEVPIAIGGLTFDTNPEMQAYEARQGRIATFDEIGDVVVLLSTPRMSLVNGHNLAIDKSVYCVIQRLDRLTDHTPQRFHNQREDRLISDVSFGGALDI